MRLRRLGKRRQRFFDEWPSALSALLPAAGQRRPQSIDVPAVALLAIRTVARPLPRTPPRLLLEMPDLPADRDTALLMGLAAVELPPDFTQRRLDQRLYPLRFGF